MDGLSTVRLDHILGVVITAMQARVLVLVLVFLISCFFCFFFSETRSDGKQAAVTCAFLASEPVVMVGLSAGRGGAVAPAGGRASSQG